MDIRQETMNEINHFLDEINYFVETIWVISSGKMVISRKGVCFQPKWEPIFDHPIAQHIFDHRMMNQEESAISFGYEASEEEIQKVILAWAQATEAFHYRFAKLDRLINTLQTAARRKPTANRARLNRLIELRQHMGDVLMTLLLDMSSQKTGQPAQLSKPGQLSSHASLLDELNRQIDVELISVTHVAQA